MELKMTKEKIPEKMELSFETFFLVILGTYYRGYSDGINENVKLIIQEHKHNLEKKLCQEKRKI
jgi:hypothetical protein